jgi:acyl-CoA reductase-like NAD-dependent aldehyde dehydrogenase
MAKTVLPTAKWDYLIQQLETLVPEMFNTEGKVLNNIAGQWKYAGRSKTYLSPVDGSLLGNIPMLNSELVKEAVAAAAAEFIDWKAIPLSVRKEKIGAVLADFVTHQQLLAYLLTWEIGKPVKQSLTSVERTISGVQWYMDNAEAMLEGREPLGLASNIASWNYPMSVLMHTMLVQALAGNSVIAKVPTDGGLYTLSFAVALARRHGLPFTLVSGSGSEIGEALIKSDEIALLNYVGGKSHGKGIALSLLDTGKRHMLEMEGVNAYGIWNFSNWELLAKQLKKGYEYGKQRCTAYVRWVIQRELFPQFLETYLGCIKTLTIGHPLLVEEGETTPPDIDFGPLINFNKVEELMGHYNDALGKGAAVVYRGRLNEDHFLPGQDISAYMAPIALLGIPKSAHLYYNEPFGPIDTFVLVDTATELINEMNVSNGNLVSSIATDDENLGKYLLTELRAFKTGVNIIRSRGDKEEAFGGIGQSWKGYFVGGKYLIKAITKGDEREQQYGNFVNQYAQPAEETT